MRGGSPTRSHNNYAPFFSPLRFEKSMGPRQLQRSILLTRYKSSSSYQNGEKLRESDTRTIFMVAKLPENMSSAFDSPYLATKI